MNQQVDDKTPIKGNPEAIALFTDTVLKIIGLYTQQVPISMIDYFLGINNVHKLIVADLATRWAVDSFPEQATFKLADQQFRQSIKEMVRALPPFDRNAGIPSHMEKSVQLFDAHKRLAADAPGTVSDDPVISEPEPTPAMVKHVLRYGGRGTAAGDDDGAGASDA